MIIELKQGFENYSSSILSKDLFDNSMQHKKSYNRNACFIYPSNRISMSPIINVKTYEKGIVKKTWKEKIVMLLKQKNIKVDDEYLWEKLLNRLDEKRTQLLCRIIEYLIEKYNFSIELYQTDGDLEELYFVIHFPPEISEEEIDEKIFQLAEYRRSIDEGKLLWFVGFTSQ